MNPGDRVRFTSGGPIATVLEVHGELLVVDVDGERREWRTRSVAAISKTIAPRGVARVNDRMLAAARQAAEGATRAELAKLYNVSTHTISQWIANVAAAAEDARNLAAEVG